MSDTWKKLEDRARRHRCLTLQLIILCALVLGSSRAEAVIQCTSPSQCCVDDVSGSSNNCSANDVTFILVGLGTQDDGCVDSSDTVSIALRAVLQNTTANTRYDIGMYMATDGDPNADGALTGQCAREDIAPAGGTGVATCGAGALDLDGPQSGVDLNALGEHDGPYLNAETGSPNSMPDACGDLAAQGNTGCDEDGDGNWDDTHFDFPTPVTFPCRDVEDDGFVNIPTCATWGNQANNVHSTAAGDVTCDSEAEVVPGTPSKCRCEDVNTTIPLPEVACTASCADAAIQPGETTTCTVTYTNTAPASCVPDPMTEERFRCGTASYIRFKTDYDETNGTVSNLSTSGTGGGGATADDGTQIVWTPDSSVGTAGILDPGNSATLTFDYTVDAGASADLTLQFITTGFWSDNSSFSPEVAQSTLTCGASLTTPVTLASFAARRDGDATVLEWSTATEAGTVGFYLYEELEDGWRRINATPIPATGVDSTVPQEYRYRAVGLSGRQVYVESIDVDGSKRLHGPFSLEDSYGEGPRPRAIDWAAVQAAVQSSPAAALRGAGKGSGSPAVHLLVDRDGLYRVTHEELAAAGFDFAGVSPSHLAVTRGGQPVPVRVEAGQRAQGSRAFGPGGFIEFYGEALDTLYTDTQVYTLAVDPSSARRVAVDRRAPAGAAPAFYMETLRQAENREYSFGSPIDDPWYHTRMLAFPGPASWSFDFDVEGYLAGAAPASLTVEVWGSTSWEADPDHHMLVALNGVPLADELFDGRTAHTVSVELPTGLLREGTNTLSLELPGDRGVDFDLVSLESYSVTYPRIFDAREGRLAFDGAGERFEVSSLSGSEVVAYRLEGGDPVLLAGLEVTPAAGGFRASLRGSSQPASYRVADAGALLQPVLEAVRPPVDITSGTADYLVISHPAFLGSVSPLVAMHASSGLAVRVVDVEDVYAQFGHGVFDPGAIRAYVDHAVRRMGTRYVLLVGGDTYDYRDYLGLGSVSFIPSLYAATGELITHAPVDPLYGDLDADNVPEVAVGRLPARTPAELDSLIAKTLEYAGKSYGRTSVFVADAFDARAAVSFTRDSDEFIAQLPAGWSVERAYLDRVSPAAARSLLTEAIERGVALTSFIGHSGPTAWTFANLFSSTDAAALNNGGLPTVVVQWGCWNAYHVEPRYETLGHAFLLSGDRGAAAVLGSATLLDTASAQRLSEELAPLLAQPGMTLGDAVTAAKQGLAVSDPDLLDVLLGWTLLGDPALVVEP